MKTGICQLCLETKPLIKNAHVLTEFLYDDLYNDKHKMTAFKFSKGQLKRNDNVQKGTRDDSLFCQKCDRFFGDQYENYARKFSIKGLKKGYEPLNSALKRIITPTKALNKKDMSPQKGL